MKIIKATDEKRLKYIEDLYLRAFPKSERKPFDLMVKKQKEGTMELLSLEEDGKFLGLAIFAHDKDIALLDYFAISDELRGQGIGSRAIKALQKIYAGKRFVLEIETTKKPCSDFEMREHRKAFYLRNGLHTMDFDVNLFGVEMEMLSNADHLDFDEYLNVYKNACGLKFADKIHLIRQVKSEEKTENVSNGITKNLVKTAFIKSLPVMAGYWIWYFIKRSRIWNVLVIPYEFYNLCGFYAVCRRFFVNFRSINAFCCINNTDGQCKTLILWGVYD